MFTHDIFQDGSNLYNIELKVREFRFGKRIVQRVR